MVKQDLVLKNETRRMIYNHILEHPGVSFVVLKKVFGLPDGTLRYHIDYLKRAEKINISKENGKRIYYPCRLSYPQNSTSENGFEKYNLNSVQESILDVLKLHSRLNQKELSRRTKLNRFKVRNNINKLMELGIVRKITNQNTVYYEYISEGQMQFEIAKALAIKLLNGEIDNKTFMELIAKLEKE
jgi:predicted transcriptional regulator